MNVIFKDDALLELYQNGKTKNKNYKKYSRDREFTTSYKEIIDLFYSLENTSQLSSFSYLHYEKLRHRPESSVRIINSRVERLLFTEEEEGITVELIEIDDKHYGKKR